MTHILVSIPALPDASLTHSGPVNQIASQRRLAAIFAADVVGYSRLMGADEIGTLARLREYRDAMSAQIAARGGRVVNTSGDSLLAEFTSVVDAIECAVAAQTDIADRNAGLDEAKRLRFRIGVHLGDVIVEDDDIFGDGVNIAARLEALAPAGGLCLSGTVYDVVHRGLDLAYTSLGEQDFKNISEPVRAYGVTLDAAAAVSAPPAAPAVRAADSRPSIAVLPFDNMSDDPEQAYFSDGITEDLITSLSKINGLFVIARNSTFAYKVKTKTVDEIARELNVRYVLEGSVRKAGQRVRITAQLIDGGTGGHLWADRFDRDLTDIFAVQDEVTHKIVAALEVKLSDHDRDNLGQGATARNVEAYDYVLRGRDQYLRYTREASVLAREMFGKAIAIDPEDAEAHAWLSLTYIHEWNQMWTSDASISLDPAFEHAKKAEALDASLPIVHTALSQVYQWRKQLDEALAEAEQAVALDPNNADALGALAETLAMAGRHEESIELIDRAIALNPHFPAWYLTIAAWANFWLRDYDAALSLVRRANVRNPDMIGNHMLLAFCHALNGNSDEAAREVDECRRLSGGDVAIGKLMDENPFLRPQDGKQFTETARLAGFPD